MSEFTWQEGYGAFSVSQSHLPALRSYIRNQEAHHRETGFKEEFLRLLNKNDVEYDERCVFD